MLDHTTVPAYFNDAQPGQWSEDPPRATTTATTTANEKRARVLRRATRVRDRRHGSSSSSESHAPFSTTTTMSHLPRRPSRTTARRVASSVSLLCLAFVALICLYPLAAKADEVSLPKYGTVIGSGRFFYMTSSSFVYADALLRSWCNVSSKTSVFASTTDCRHALVSVIHYSCVG